MEKQKEFGTGNKLYNKPNLLIVGAAKSGTTSLVKYLNQHPDIYFHPNKELRFFVRDSINNISKKDPLYKGIHKQSILDKDKYFTILNNRKNCR